MKRAKALKNHFLMKKVNSFSLWSEHFKPFDFAVDFDLVYFHRFESYILVLQSPSDTAAAPSGYQCLENPLPFDWRTNRDDFQEGFVLYVNCS